MRLTLLRHGESDANLARVFSNTGWKHPLSEKGRAQAASMARKLAGERPVAAVFSSPLQRAVETAEIIAEPLGLPVRQLHGLIEYHVGLYEDGPFTKEAAAAQRRVERAWFDGEIEAHMPCGECAMQIAARLSKALGEIAAHPGAADAHVVAVSHGGVLHHGLPLIVRNIPPRISLTRPLGECARVTLIRIAGRWQALSWNGMRLTGAQRS